MPLYEYGCSACGRTSEISHRMSDPPAVTCPLCGQATLSKQISAAGFRLKGAGWYETDFKADGKRNLAGDGGSGDAKPATETKADAKADAKPASKPDSKPDAKADAKPAAKPDSKPSAPASSGSGAAPAAT